MLTMLIYSTASETMHISSAITMKMSLLSEKSSSASSENQPQSRTYWLIGKRLKPNQCLSVRCCSFLRSKRLRNSVPTASRSAVLAS